MRLYSLTDSPAWVLHDDGVNAPLIHQQIISRLHVGLGILYYRDRTLAFEPLTETMLGEETSPTPDLILFDEQATKTRVIIEVCGDRGQKSDLRKVIQLIDDEDYGIQEGFVYNYKAKHWLRYQFGDGGQANESSFSNVLNLDLNSLL